MMGELSFGVYCTSLFSALAQISLDCDTYFTLIRNSLQYPPNMTQFTGQVRFIGYDEGPNINIFCGSPYTSDVSWFFIPPAGDIESFKELTPLGNYELKIENYSDFHSLIVHSGQLQDEGLYTCIFKNGNIYTDDSTRLHIYALPRLIPEKQKVVGFTNREITLRCSLLEDSGYEIAWKRHEKVLTDSSSKYSISRNESTSFFNIKELESLDAGRYDCFIQNKPDIHQKIILYIRSYFGHHQIEDFIIAYIGENLNVTCQGEANRITDLIHLEKFTSLEKIKGSVFALKNGSVNISIPRIEKHHEGVIYCHMEDTSLLKRSYKYLAVIEEPKLLSEIDDRPYINAYEYSSVKMKCEVHPFLGERQIKWIKIHEQKPIAIGDELHDTSSGYTLSTNYYTSLLTIRNVNLNHKGIYQCQLGSQLNEFHLSVTEIAKILGVRYKEVINIASNAIFKCDHEKTTHINVTWLHNGTNINSRRDKYIILELNFTSLLVFYNASSHDSGIYTCCYDVYNNDCADRDLINLSLRKDMFVQVIDTSVRIFERLRRAMYVLEDDKAVLPCVMEELVLNATLTWILPNGFFIPCTSNVTVIRRYKVYSTELNCTLEIDKHVAEDDMTDEIGSGTYMCKVLPRNILIITIDLNILSQPKFSHEFMNMTAYLNYSFALTSLILNPDDMKIDLERITENGFEHLFTEDLRKGDFARVSYNIPFVSKGDEGNYTFLFNPPRTYKNLISSMKIYVRVKAPPIITASDAEVFVGQKATLKCEIENHEGFKIKWERILAYSNVQHFDIQVENCSNKRILSLHYENTYGKEDGIYQCLAIGSHTVFSESVRLTVLVPIFDSKDVEVTKGEEATITFKIKNLGPNMEIILHHWETNVKYAFNQRYILSEVENNRGFTISLFIHNAMESDEGPYTCWVIGTSSFQATSYLTVNDPAK